MTRATLICLIALTAPAALDAQILPTFVPGDRVRVTDFQGRETIGGVGSSSTDSLVVSADGFSPMAFRPETMSLVEVSTGRSGNVLRTMLIVTGVGAAVGATLGAVAYEPCEHCLITSPRSESAVAGALFVGVISVPVGLVAGLLTADEGWRRVSLDRGQGTPEVSFRVAPTPKGGLRIAGRIALGPG